VAFNNPDKTAANASRFEQAQDYEELKTFSVNWFTKQQKY
jgi:hypothetical protein